METLHISIVFFNTNSFAVTLKEVLNESLIRAGVFKILVRRILVEGIWEKQNLEDNVRIPVIETLKHVNQSKEQNFLN